MMAKRGSAVPQEKVTLKDIVKCSGQPISEEQAWALCYQCCTNLQQLLLGGGRLPALRNLASICLHCDGTVSFSPPAGSLDSNQTEKKVVEDLAKLVYKCLDWGLNSDVERVLSDSLDNLFFCMLGLDGDNRQSPSWNVQPITLKEVIKECVERLFLPSEASDHYKSVCRMQYAVHMEICNLLQTIKQSKQNLKLNSDERCNSIVVYENWGTLWSSVIREISLGIRLCSAKQRSYRARPIEYKLTPHEILMEDIRGKRYTLRQVKENDQNKSSRSEENIILDRINSLKPATERKLRARPHEEPSLHELLMTEIRSSRRLRSTADRKKCFSPEEDLCSVHHDYPYYRCRLKSKLSCLHTIDFQDHPTDERGRWNTDFSYESSSEQKFSDLTSGSSEISFFPVWTSSQVDLRMSSGHSHKLPSTITSNLRIPLSCHKRSSSCEGSFLGCSSDEQIWDTPGINLPPTISQLLPVRQMIVKTEMAVLCSSRNFLGQKVCSSCHKRLFCWRVLCKFCQRNICADCHIEMLMPFQKCMNLPVSFFKALVLNQQSDPDSLTQKDLLHWDSLSVPLVLFHPRHVSGGFHKWLMYNWTSMPICLKCQEYILDMIARSLPSSMVASGGLKSRTMSESSARLLRH